MQVFSLKGGINMKKPFKIAPEIQKERFFELFGEEFTIRHCRFFKNDYIIINVKDIKLCEYIGEKFEKTQSFSHLFGIVFNCENQFCFYKYGKGVKKPDFLTRNIISRLKNGT